MSDVSATHEWRSLNEFVVGDTIHQWGDDLPVTRIVPSGYRIKLYYMDTNDEEHFIDNRALAEYIAKKRVERP